MVVITEYRIPIPFSLKEITTGLKYCEAKMTKEESYDGQGVEIVKNEPFTNHKEYGSGIYQKRIYHLESRLPSWIVKTLPAELLKLEEESWRNGIWSKTIVKCPYVGENFSITILTNVKGDDAGTEENVLNLSKDDLKKRKIVPIDIASQKFKYFSDKETKDLCPDKIKLVKAKRGPLEKEWIKNTKPISCVYKVVYAECKWRLIGGRIENFVISVEHDVFTKLFRILYCSADSWIEMTSEQVAKFEQDVMDYLAENIKKAKQQKESIPAKLEQN